MTHEEVLLAKKTLPRLSRLSDARRGQSADTEITILVIGKVIEYFLVADAIGEYNSELRISLKMSLAFSSMNVPQLRISFSF